MSNDVAEGIDYLKQHMRNVDHETLETMEQLRRDVTKFVETTEALQRAQDGRKKERLAAQQKDTWMQRHVDVSKGREGQEEQDEDVGRYRERYHSLSEDQPAGEDENAQEEQRRMEALQKPSDLREPTEDELESILRGLDVLQQRCKSTEAKDAMEGLRVELESKMTIKKEEHDVHKARKADAAARFEQRQISEEDHEAERLEQDRQDHEGEEEKKMTPEEHLEVFRSMYDRVQQNIFARMAMGTFETSKKVPLMGRFMQLIENVSMKAVDVAPKVYEDYFYDGVERLYEIYQKEPTAWPGELASAMSPRNVLLWTLQKNARMLNDRLRQLRHAGNEASSYIVDTFHDAWH
ncbi:hypothetical protein AAVH_17119 [Aphelenchoides avenae]|nr:hypothetical protein AAVH_17119 [Aphelenchus avenae]